MIKYFNLISFGALFLKGEQICLKKKILKLRLLTNSLLGHFTQLNELKLVNGKTCL